MSADHNCFARTLARIAVAGCFIYGLYAILHPFFFPIVTGAVISTVFRPLYALVERLVRVKTLAAFLTIILIAAVIVLPLAGLVALLAREISGLSLNLADGKDILPQFDAFVNHIGHGLGWQGDFHLTDYAQRVIEFLTNNSGLLAGSVLGWLGSSFIALVTAFYLLQSQDRFHKAVQSFSPLSPEDTQHVFTRTREVVTATVNGNLVLVGLQAVASSLNFFLFGVSSPLLLGVLYGVASLVPAVGSALIWVPVAGYQFYLGNTAAAIGISLWAIGQVVLLDNYVGPRLIESRANLHPFLVLLGVLGGVSSFGFIGLVVGPTIVALGIVGLEILAKSWRNPTLTA